MGKRVEIRVIAAALFGLWAATSAQAECRPGQLEAATDQGKVTFGVAVADDFMEQSRGLMHVKEMADNQGMLFIYGETRKVSFWMKNTFIPLDMVFIDARGVVKKVHANAVPHDTTSIPSDFPIRSVLEINGGLAERLGIRPGSVVRHADLPQTNAAWPC